MIKEIVRNSECDHPPKTPFLKWNCNIDDDLERMICMMERHFPFPYAALQIYATRGCNAENSTFNMKRNFEKDLFFHRRPIERIGQLWIWLHISIRTFPKFPICSVKDFMQFVCLQVCGCLGQRERERESRSKTETFDSACGSQLSSTTSKT